MGFSFRANYGNIINTEKPSSKWETIYAYVYVVVNFLSQVNFCFSFVFGYGEVETKGKKIT